MNTNERNLTMALLALSAALLASLIPGGPIENRDFSHIPVSILTGFNLFLTALNLGSVALLYFVFRQQRWSISVVWFVGLAYFIVYAIDLAQLFPRSPTSMSQTLSLIEVLGMCAAVPLMYLSWPYIPFASRNNLHQERKLDNSVIQNNATPITGLRMALMAVAIAVGVGIIFFATDSAMNPTNGAEFLAQ